jgi:pyruvate/2-oxoglutarate dehydrogenase complex dihydrolipoamide dehydrogenase (E3) component
VMVIGAGPAGLQAAISAVRHGHRVTVYERELVAGGQVRWAASVPNRAEFGDLVRNQLHELQQLGVEVLYGRSVDAAAVATKRPDVVVMATGSVPARPYWAPADDPRIVDVIDVLTGRVAPVEGKVVIVDELGFHQATSTAEVLADRGCSVEILTPGMVVGQDLGITLDMENFCMRAGQKGIVLTPDSVVMGWNGQALSVLHHVSGRMLELAADLVVLAVPGSPADALYSQLLGEGHDVRRVGDCLAPRRAHSAVIDGDRLGAQL